jgi:hypothetical protein
MTIDSGAVAVHDTLYLRSQAHLCLQMAGQISDRAAAKNLRSKAARFFAQANDLESGPDTLATATTSGGAALMCRFHLRVDYTGCIYDDHDDEFVTVHDAEAHATIVANELTQNSDKKVTIYVVDDDGSIKARVATNT